MPRVRVGDISMTARMPAAELRIVEGTGHGCFWERPDLFNALCLEFLGRAASGGGPAPAGGQSQK